MRVSKRAQEAEVKKTHLEIAILDLWDTNDLEPEELLQVLARSMDHILAHDLRTHVGTASQLEMQHAIEALLEPSGLTKIEFLQALTSVMQSRLKYDLRYERHGNYDTPSMFPTEDEERQT